MLHVRVTGVGSTCTLPAASMARAENVWLPCESPVNVAGSLHAVKAAPSSEHWNVTPVSGDERSKVAVVEFTLPPGPETMLVSGATVSTVHPREAGVGSTLPAVSTARTSSVWRALREAGEGDRVGAGP
jgi:hypothetical protein